MQEFIIEFLDKFGYFGIALLIAIENIFPPIPSEIILTFAGFMTTYTSMKIWLVILFATIGSVIGAIILYIVGRILNVERLEKILEGKIGKILRLKKDDVEKANKWFVKHGKKTVFFCRFIPIVRSLISIPAGVSKMKFHVFLVLTTIGTLIWNTVLILLGRIAGDTWEKIAGYFDVYSTIALIVILIVCGIVGIIFIKTRFLNKNKNESDEKNSSNEKLITNENDLSNEKMMNNCKIDNAQNNESCNISYGNGNDSKNNNINTCQTELITNDIKDKKIT